LADAPAGAAVARPSRPAENKATPCLLAGRPGFGSGGANPQAARGHGPAGTGDGEPDPTTTRLNTALVEESAAATGRLATLTVETDRRVRRFQP